VSVVLSIACGHDASYPFKTTGAAESPVITGQCEAGYYLSVVEKGGEPAGIRWFGLEWAYRPASKGRVIAAASRVAELETLRDLARTVCVAPRRNGTDRDAPRHTCRTRAHVCAARVARRTHACARTCGHGRRSRAGARVTSGPLRCSAPAAFNYRRSYMRARLEAR
jgi:hypothetical protein